MELGYLLAAIFKRKEPTLTAVASKVSFNVFDNVTYKDNLIKMEIYFEEFNFQHISESPGYAVGQCWLSLNAYLYTGV